MMVILWITEALPLAVTALIGPVLAIILQVAPARTVFAPFADPIIFLFIGSFMLAEAMFAHGLDRRIAYGALSSRAVGGSPTRILLVYGAVATGISMWISNTATTAMMFPIGLSIVAHLTKGRESEMASRNFATAMMLMAAFGASIGGMGTPIGTPPNLIGKGMLERIAHEQHLVLPVDDRRRPAHGAPLRVPRRLLPVAAAQGPPGGPLAGGAHPGRS